MQSSPRLHFVPLLFNIYMLQLPQIIITYKISSNYADDTHLYITMRPGDIWMYKNFLQLNKEKSEITVFITRDEALKNRSSQTLNEHLLSPVST